MKETIAILLLFAVQFTFAQQWRLFYANNKVIHKFSVSADGKELCIADGDKIRIIKGVRSKNFYSQPYILNIGDSAYHYKAYFNEIKSLLYVNKDLYVATNDSNVIHYKDMHFIGGFPAYIYDHVVYHDRNDYAYVAGFNILNRATLFGMFDVDEGIIYPYVNPDSLYNNALSDIAIEGDENFQFCIDGSHKVLISIVASGTIIYNRFDFSLLDFNKFIEVQGIDDVIYRSGRFMRKYNLWAITDQGLALYSSRRNDLAFKDWKESNWVSYTVKNSWLLSDKLFHLDRVYPETPFDTNFIVFSNSPFPTMYYFDPKGNILCIMDYSNSKIKKDLPIVDVAQDENNHVYVAQGKYILQLTLEEKMKCSRNRVEDLEKTEPRITIFPNPVNRFLKIKSDKIIDKCIIYSSAGEVMDVFHGREYCTSKLSSGLYFLKVHIKGEPNEVVSFVIQ